MAELILYDSYIQEMKSFFSMTSEKSQNQVDEVTQLLNETLKNAVMEGKVSEALQEYIETLTKLNGVIREYGVTASAFVDAFQKTIDEVDKRLY